MSIETKPRRQRLPYPESHNGHSDHTPALAERWVRIGRTLGLDADALLTADGKRTRREWLRAAGSAR